MKAIYIVRHAKSSWDISTLNDFDRSLNERGQRDAPMMAKRLLEKNILIDAFISSTANRALTTAVYFADEYGVKENSIIKKRELYHAAPKTFYEVISSVDNNLNSIAVFSHNPGITDFANELTNTHIDNMPTCSVFAVKIDTDSWKNFAKAKKTFLFFDYHKIF